MARPTKLTAELQERIVTAIRAGSYAEQAAAYAGVHRATYYRWLAQGKDTARGACHDFYEAVTRAEAEAEVAAVLTIRRAATKHYQAATWWLERRFPQRWGRVDRVDPQSLLRTEAEKTARQQGLPAEEILAETERIFEER
jgi:transposase